MPEHSDLLPERSLETPQDAVTAAVELIASARRSLCVFCPLLPPVLFNATEFNDILRHQLLQEPRLHSFILAPPAKNWRQACPQLTQLVERLSSLELRTPPADELTDRKESSQIFLIADKKAVMLLTDPRRCVGLFNAAAELEARKLLDFFNPLWEKSQTDTELRRLGI